MGESDTLPPHVYNKMTRRLEPNPEFIKLHDERALNFVGEREAERIGLPKLSAKIKEQKAEKRQIKIDQARQLEYAGSHEKGVSETIKALES